MSSQLPQILSIEDLNTTEAKYVFVFWTSPFPAKAKPANRRTRPRGIGRLRWFSSSPSPLTFIHLPKRWVSLKKINWQDQSGRTRVWEVADRRTRGSSGIDAVAILALIRSKTRAFPLSTVIVEQYRPPVGKFVVELPAGLIDDGETPEAAAIRELREETGYEAKGALDSSAVLATDPGMTTANMKLVILDVPLDGDMDSPEQDLDDGESIVRRAVEVKDLYRVLKEYNKKEDYIVDARLLHLAAGFDLAERLKTGAIAS